MGEKTGAGFPGNVCSILFDWEDGVIRATKSLDIVALIDGIDWPFRKICSALSWIAAIAICKPLPLNLSQGKWDEVRFPCKAGRESECRGRLCTRTRTAI